MAPTITPSRLRAIRQALPALAHTVYMNTGTAGPLPEPAADALRAALAEQVAHGRAGHDAMELARATADAARAALASLLATTPDRLALLHHSTDGLNAVALGLRWRSGDAVLITDLEHAAVQLVAGMLRLRGVEVRLVRLAGLEDPAEMAAAVAEQLRDGAVRAVMLSHVSYASGAVLPLAAISAAAHAAGAAVVVDGAQGTGALRVQPAQLGCDFYTVSGQKWLCGPEGTGALWIAPGWEERLLPGPLGYRGVVRMDGEGHHLPAPGARRLEVGTTFWPAVAAWTASLRWIGEIGWEAVWTRIHLLTARARGALGEIPGVQVLTPAAHAGLCSFHVAGRTGVEVNERLVASGFGVRSIPGWEATRASLGFFLEEAEVDGLATAVRALAEQA